MAVERPTGDCGRLLREARERRGVSLRDIATTTKISMSALEALERNDISRLPGGLFSRAFVRAYASEVGLDPEATVRAFLAQFPEDSVTAGHAAAEPAEEHQAVESDRRMAATFVRLIAVSVPVAAAVLYFGMGRGEAPAGAPAGQAAIAAPPGGPPSPPPSESAPVEPAAGAGEAVDRLMLSVRATRECWISVSIDGRDAVERTLQAGDQQTFEARQDVVIRVGDAQALAVTLNGVDARPLGRPGQVITRQITLANFREYLAVP